MRTILFLTGLIFIININILVGQQNNIKTIEDVRTIEEFRNFKFLFKIIDNKVYKSDTDRYVWGVGTIEINIDEEKELKKKEKKNLKQSSKFKSTYLDFTIIQEENIS